VGGDAASLVVGRLRARRTEIEEAIFAGVRAAVRDPGSEPDSEYVEGMRAAVAAAVRFGLAGLEQGADCRAVVPPEAIAQARRAARSGVSLEAVLRRYIVGHALLWDYVMQEADGLQRTWLQSGLREMSRAQAALLDQLVIAVTREHIAELQRATRSREHRLLERVRLLLAGEDPDRALPPDGLDRELGGYDLAGEHLGVIALGTGCEAAMRAVAGGLERRLLCVARERGMVWAWLGGRGALRAADFERACSQTAEDVRFVLGEPASGMEGWRLTHSQAQAALLVARSRRRRITRYADVALVAAALGDDLLARSLSDMYLAPLEGGRGGATALRETLGAYFAAERNASSAASALGVARSTVESRLRIVEERLGRPLHSCPAELELALRLAALDVPADVDQVTFEGNRA
jgi:hypothetical protein